MAKTPFEKLHVIIERDDVAPLRHELDSGVNADLSNELSWTMLMLGAINGNTQITELLISRGAGVNAINDSGETALTLAAHRGHTRFIQLLLDGARGFSEHATNRYLLWLPIAIAASRIRLRLA
jgi:ankyrin repeat protein